MTTNQLKLSKLPDTPGVYFFLNKQKKPIYIGKATSLRDRVRSYFSKDLIATRGRLLVNMLGEAKSVEFNETASVLEALLLEADLIKKFQPTYNTQEKDDKSFICVVLTDEDFPQLLLIRKKDLGSDPLQALTPKLQATFGPYPNGLQLKDALKIIRRIFPYRDAKCFPKGHPRNKSGKACFCRQVGLCPGVCTGEVSKKDYAKTIRHLKTFLSGLTAKLLKNLQNEMMALANERRFEEAEVVKRQIYALEHINDISLIRSDQRTPNHSPTDTTFRIEAYDISHMSGKNIVGVMTVFENGEPAKGEYRKFIIRSRDNADDTGSLKEIISRRLKHSEWRLPDLIVVDGGQAQLNSAKVVLTDLGVSIPVASVVKDIRHKPRAVLGDPVLTNTHKREIVFANSEAHRFAIAFHKKKRRKSFLG